MDVLIVLGSTSDKERGKEALSTLEGLGVDAKIVVASAHRSPDRLREIVRKSDANVFIAMAGMSAALPGAVASLTTRPVIGVPLSGKLNLDSILSVIQMPPGVPVAAVSLDGARNAALLAAEILGLSDDRLHERLREYREDMTRQVVEGSESVGD